MHGFAEAVSGSVQNFGAITRFLQHGRGGPIDLPAADGRPSRTACCTNVIAASRAVATASNARRIAQGPGARCSRPR